MASADNQPSDQIGQTEEKEKTTMESGSSTSEELRKVQVANEGMRLLLSSRLKDAENLFVKSRSVASTSAGVYMYMCVCVCDYSYNG
jgi:hypothetical protein